MLKNISNKIFNRKINKSANEKKKIGFSELVWMGFSFTCAGVTFTNAFAVTISSSDTGIGYWVFLVVLLCGLFAGGTSWAYNKCSRVFNATNGGGYIYVRAAFGKFWGWIFGVLQYITLPTSIIVCILALIDQNIGSLIPESVPVIGNGDRWQHLILNIIGMGIYFIFSFAIYFGVKGMRIAVNFASVLQWISSALIIGCAIYLFAQNGMSIYNKKSSSSLSLSNLNSSIASFVYFYVGFETYSTIGKNIKNAKKNLGKIMIATLGIITLFYMIVTFVFIGAIGIDSFKNNSGATGIIDGPNPSVEIVQLALGGVATAIMIVAILATKLNACIQSSLYGGGMLEPLALEGYISENFAKMRKDNIPFKASIANTIFTMILSFAMLILPNLMNVDFDFSVAVGFSSFYTMLIYLLVILATFKLSRKTQMKLKIWEYIFMGISLVAYTWLCFFYFVQLFENIFSNVELVVNVIQLALLFITIVLAIGWYYGYYLPKYKKRIEQNPEIQKTLDKIFAPSIEEYTEKNEDLVLMN